MIYALIIGIYKCKIFIIPRLFENKRKYTVPHNLNLRQNLLRCYKHVPKIYDVSRIDHLARKNLMPIRKTIDSVVGYSELSVFLAGSTSERFNVPVSCNWILINGFTERSHAIVSDFDYMISSEHNKASFTPGEEKYVIMTNNPNLQTGFVLLQDQNQIINAKKFRNDFLTVLSKLKLTSFEGYIPSTRILDCCLCNEETNYGAIKLKGPAIELRIGSNRTSVDRFYADVTFSVKCSQWPGRISNWQKRDGKRWPDGQDVERIVKQGCHLVPKSQLNDSKGETWRISFSQAEVELSQSVPELSRVCFIGVKIIAKDHLWAVCRKITSYQMKCIFFNTLETTDPSIWLSYHNLESCFQLLLQAIFRAIDRRSCPHFWIPEINLFADLTDSDVGKLLKKMRQVQEKPSQFVEPFISESEWINFKRLQKNKQTLNNYGSCEEAAVINFT